MKFGLGLALTNLISGSSFPPEPVLDNALLGSFQLDFSPQVAPINSFGGLEISNDFQKLWISTVNEDDIFEYDTTVSNDRITSAVFNNFTALTLAAPRDITFNPDFTEVSIVNTATDQAFVYPLVTQGTVLDGLGAASSTYTDSTNMNAPFNIVWNSDRTRFFVITNAAVNTQIAEFSVPVAGSVDSASFVTVHNFSAIGNCSDFVFSATGLTMIFCELLNDNIVSIPLSVPFDLSTADFGNTTTFDFSGATGDTHPDAIAMNASQTALYIFGSTTRIIYEVLIPQEPLSFAVPMNEINASAVFDYDARILESYDPDVDADNIFNYINDPAYQMVFNPVNTPVFQGTKGTPSANLLFDNRSTNIRQIQPEPTFTNQRCITSVVNQATYCVQFVTPSSFDSEPKQTLLGTQNPNPLTRGYQFYYDRPTNNLAVDFMDGVGPSIFTTSTINFPLVNNTEYIAFISFNGIGTGVALTIRLYDVTNDTVDTQTETVLFSNVLEGTGRDSWLANDSGTSRTMTNATTNHRSGFNKVLSVGEIEQVFNQLIARSGIEPPPVLPSAPNIIGSPVISGIPEEGQVLTLTPAPVEGNPIPTQTYQWFRAPSTPIPGATGLNYVATNADLTFQLFGRETATNALGTDSADSALTAPIAEPTSGFIPANLLYNSAKDYDARNDIPLMNFPFGLHVNEAQTLMIISSRTNDSIEYWDFGTVADPSTAALDAAKSLPWSGIGGPGVVTRVEELYMTEDGNTIIFAENNFPDGFIYTLDLGTPNNPSTGVLNATKTIALGTVDALGFSYTNDGLTLAIVLSNADVRVYDLSVAYDNSTAVRNLAKEGSISTVDTAPTDIDFTDNDNKLIILGNSGNKLSMIELAAPGDISSFTYDPANDLSIPQDGNPNGLTFLRTGGRAYVIGVDNETARVYE